MEDVPFIEALRVYFLQPFFVVSTWSSENMKPPGDGYIMIGHLHVKGFLNLEDATLEKLCVNNVRLINTSQLTTNTSTLITLLTA